ncbi:hypothetical protein AUEXF2481DRAFT_4580 [Aureobasidium subglaciale EXF-2481]|uniref:Uncharacterized protein n=1 Tax=Aureobasidium subglaciale (strain EXF-2481) TaxID=1043005 RepID=A0A074YNH1_AURSE|nr:uncharacterized protein AUEXF2481DRAFT_4580 [Aureobasidium subglaciale EXF-2481]KAI5194475.1 hypothetical protein E4T38_09574 [Aureobasidium subglaciale]KAI5213720.1 hypothetical protein E4T40_09516 [Aureobasidium subglaciale]KAI5215555.1 hypothetical protein E4T41_09532 [Aureobasidium subglaciale]KAI5253537.1 hypothetical protein E4T46_09508 [Aureobasidium subglaciale]KEQ95607.1 hypothetical protein AUEXF2481DRAFT_4580 [Aureobasidium subglaciale EXF-2481]
MLDDSDRCIIIPSDEELDAYFAELERRQLEARCFLTLPPIESLSRDTCAEILWIVAGATEEEPVKISLWLEFITDTLFGEWAWVVHLDEKVLEAYSSWDRYEAAVETNVRFGAMLKGKPLLGLVKKFAFKELPEDHKEFLASFKALEIEEDSKDGA